MKPKILTAAMACIMVFSTAAIPTFAEDVRSSSAMVVRSNLTAIENEGEETSVQVTLTPEATVFSATVPTSLAISVDSDGNTSVSTDDIYISNNGYAPIVIESITVTSDNWDFISFSEIKESSSSLGMDANVLALEINGEEIEYSGYSGDVSLFYDDDSSPYIRSNETASLSYDALVTARSSTDSVQIATVTIVLDWYSGEYSYLGGDSELDQANQAPQDIL